MATNGRLDVSTLVDWDGHQNYLTPEAARQWIAFRQAYHDATGYWLYTSECYRPVGEPGDYARGRINTQWYWFEYYDRNSKWAAVPGSTSSHGWAVAADLVGWPERATLIALAAEYGFTFPFSYEDWHIQYVGNPSTIASSTTQPIGEDELPTPNEVWDVPQPSLKNNAPSVVLDAILQHTSERSSKPVEAIICGQQDDPEYGSMAVWGDAVPGGWQRVSTGRGDRSLYGAWRALTDKLGFSMGEPVEVDKNGWTMAQGMLSKPEENNVIVKLPAIDGLLIETAVRKALTDIIATMNIGGVDLGELTEVVDASIAKALPAIGDAVADEQSERLES